MNFIITSTELFLKIEKMISINYTKPRTSPFQKHRNKAPSEQRSNCF